MTSKDPFDISSQKEHSSGDESKSAITSSCENQLRAFTEAAEAIVCPTGEDSGFSAPFGSEIRNLEIWASDQALLIPDTEFNDFNLVSNSTSEHQVFLRVSDSRIIKRTLAGVFGQIPCVGENKLSRKNANPSEYLKRMALQLAVFGGDISLEGVTISDKPSMVIGQPSGQPSLVISQKWYEKDGSATNEAIHDFLVREGFRSVPESYFGWYRPIDRVVIVDAKADNFIKTDAGLVPIDLQMAIFSEAEMQAAGLTGDPDAPVIFVPRS